MIGERYIAVSDLRKHLEILKKETCWNTNVCDADTIERVLMVAENELTRIDTIGPRQLSSKLLKSISMAIEIQCDMAKDHRKRYREQKKSLRAKIICWRWDFTAAWRKQSASISKHLIVG